MKNLKYKSWDTKYKATYQLSTVNQKKNNKRLQIRYKKLDIKYNNMKENRVFLSNKVNQNKNQVMNFFKSQINKNSIIIHWIWVITMCNKSNKIVDYQTNRKVDLNKY